jgi:hypothetical protein
MLINCSLAILLTSCGVLATTFLSAGSSLLQELIITEKSEAKRNKTKYLDFINSNVKIKEFIRCQKQLKPSILAFLTICS